MPQGTNLTNPWPEATDKGRVQANIDQTVFNYFFRGVFAGTRGPRETLICIFFQKLHEACIFDGIAPAWDETNELRIAAILDKLNFHDVPGLIADLDAARANATNSVSPVSAQSEPGPGDTIPKRSRRPTRPSPIPPSQSVSEGHDGE